MPFRHDGGARRREYFGRLEEAITKPKKVSSLDNW